MSSLRCNFDVDKWEKQSGNVNVLTTAGVRRGGSRGKSCDRALVDDGWRPFHAEYCCDPDALTTHLYWKTNQFLQVHNSTGWVAFACGSYLFLFFVVGETEKRLEVGILVHSAFCTGD